MDRIHKYLIAGANIYNCKDCTKVTSCIRSLGPRTKTNSDRHFHRQYPGMLEIRNVDIANNTQTWCLHCGFKLTEEHLTPCDAFYCPACEVICPIVMKESL